MASKRPYNSIDQGIVSKKPFNSSDLKFISFTQSVTRNDGSRSQSSSNLYQERSREVARMAAPDIDVMSMVSTRQVQDARRWMEKLHVIVKQRMNSEQGSAKSMTDNLSHCIQMMKTNPQYNYVELNRVNVDDIPTNVKKGFNTFPTEGFVCECRVQVS